MRIGYVPYWDQDRAFDVVRRNAELLDEISPVWYSLEATGRVRLADLEQTTVEPATVRELQDHGIRVVPTITNLRDGDWDPEVVKAMLHDPAAMSTHIDELVDLAVTEGYDGIDVDYEHLSGAERAAYSEFLARLGTELRANGKTLATAVHPKTSDAGYDERNLAQDYTAIGSAVDQVRVMTYDYSWDTSPPGPMAPVDWVDDVIAWTVTQIPPEKVFLGIVLLGYDWGAGPGVTVDHEQARTIAARTDAAVQRTDDGSPWFTYDDPSGDSHEVWYEDAESARVKLDLVAEYGLGGAFFWRLGGEDARVWPMVRDVLR
jgi:spore germination protein